MKRRSLFKRLGIIAAAVALAPAVKAEAAPSLRDGSAWGTAPNPDLVEARMAQQPLTFEAMQTDCRSRGCAFTQEGPTIWMHKTPRDAFSNDWEARYFSPGTTYERVDAWRRSLHEQTGVAALIDRSWEADVLAAGNTGRIIRIPHISNLKVHTT